MTSKLAFKRETTRNDCGPPQARLPNESVVQSATDSQDLSAFAKVDTALMVAVITRRSVNSLAKDEQVMNTNKLAIKAFIEPHFKRD